jgi:putative transposase
MYKRAIKVRLYPTKEQQVLLGKCFGCDRWMYNKGLAFKINRYKQFKQSVSWLELSWMLTFWKKTEELSWLKEVPRCLFEQSLKKLDKAYQGFFKLGRGFPKFKSKNDKQSFTLSAPSNIVGNTIKLPKMKPIKIKGLRKFNGKIKNITITKNKVNQYFASWSVEDVIEKVKLTKDKVVGIDVNIENFSTDSNGLRTENPKFKNKVFDKIKFYQKRSSKCVKGSNNRKYWNLKVAKEYQKISNKKQDFLHKLSSYYVKNHDVIVVEDLKISNMLKNHRLAESISNVSWGEFFRQLEYKSLWDGVEFIKVNPKNTSKTCSYCGKINTALTLNNRVWKCECGKEHVRDFNASLNIKGRGTILKVSGGIS